MTATGSRTPSLQQLLSHAAEQHPQRPSLVDVAGRSLTYRELFDGTSAISAQLRARGIGPGDRVAACFADGVPAAIAFLGVATSCAAAPFNPRLTASELHRCLLDLRPRALVLAADGPDVPRDVARSLDLPVWELNAGAEAEGGWCLTGAGPHAPASSGSSDGRDVGLMLYTSGTTSRPKLVPLTQGNLCASAQNISRTLQLQPSDRCLNVMPLFHIHGLVAGLLSSLAAGASVVCAPGFSAVDFFRWVDATGPTWYSAVPTMHQAILARLEQLPPRAFGHRFRFVRSSSASLAPDVMASLEAAFQAPVIEAYGMTEASHQMASNPLPPAARKPGSVGRPDGAEIAILSEQGSGHLPRGTVGEVAIRGDGVTAGYVDHPQANADAFTSGWFRTGDQGYFDRDGYLTLTGRLKELINRAGEKIAPREVDEALMAHADVLQAVAFAVPDPAYGEQVAAAVVLRAGATVTEDGLRSLASERLAPFKVPTRIVFVDEVPKGPTGKLQRRGLAETLGLLKPDMRPEVSTGVDPDIVDRVAAIWCEVLECGDVPADIDFIRAGGDSLGAVKIVNRLTAAFGVEFTLADVFAAPTIAAQAQLVGRTLSSSPRP
jgi:oxalate---CoA ligase